MLSLPNKIKTDNGLLFQGQEFNEFMTSLGIRHRKITPQWPQANGEVERFMRTLNKTLRIEVEQGEDAQCCMHRFLRAYRHTSYSTMKCSPIDLLMRIPARDTIPVSTFWQPGEMDMQRMQSKRQSTNNQASRDRRAATPTIAVGDIVVIRDRYRGARHMKRNDGKPLMCEAPW